MNDWQRVVHLTAKLEGLIADRPGIGAPSDAPATVTTVLDRGAAELTRKLKSVPVAEVMQRDG